MNVQRNAKKKAEQRNKEAQKREAESQNRKHLAGLRVVQKNLVYVVGLSPGISENELLKTLRGPQYFGQYGPIVKIVVSKNKNGEPATNNNSLGVYVTFASKDDAEKCIQAVNGSQNGDRVLRAQYGTTKYCSAYLRNETCTNKQCMFLHEPGDNDDSYSRQDLSTINSVNTQRPLQAPQYTIIPTVASQRKEAILHAPPAIVPLAAATSQQLQRDGSKDNSENADGSALPTTAGWAKPGQQSSRRQSVATSAATSSPAVSASLPAPPPAEEVTEMADDASDQDRKSSSTYSAPAPKPAKPSMDPVLHEILKSINYLSSIQLHDNSKKERDALYVPLWDDQGGLKRRLRREEAEARLLAEETARQEMEAERQAAVSEAAEEQEPGSGSGQLGGEPEDDEREAGNQGSNFHDQRRPSAQMPIQRGSADASAFGGVGTFSPNATASINGRSLTPLQQQQLMLLKSGQPQSGFTEQYPPGIGLGGQSRLLQQQSHGRQLSRYNFTNEGPSSSKTAPNTKLLGQQQAMGIAGSQFYASTVPGPPPGLKSTGTPPNAMFGQQFGGSAFGTNKENNEVLRDMLRNRGGIGAAGAGVGQSHEAGKREFMFPFSHQYPSTSTPVPASNLLASLYGAPTRSFQEFGSKQKKKGKKHRHANTSSSGGSALVDLADPSILQSRMPHQHQSNIGIGQGLFGGQTQGGYNNQNMMYGGGAAFRGAW